mmetsp:Transcript_19477/g.66221  ORF Transcript_19477/g.66221 Transcript_19477/m.66221 type:complete len:424 (-) Transcript_19477:235-1506(-)
MAVRVQQGMSCRSHRRLSARTQRAAGARRSGVRAAAVLPAQDSPAVDHKYAAELEAMTRAVRLATVMCQKVQTGIMQKEESSDTKQDRSLVTIADYGAQALVSWTLAQAFDDVQLVAEEDSEALREGGEGGSDMLDRVVGGVNSALASFGDLPASCGGTAPTLGADDVLRAIDRGGCAGGATGRHYVLDPVDGTLGFVKGDQYAVALALVEDGKVVAGVLGCPNMPVKGDILEFTESYTYGYSPAQVSKMLAGAEGAWHKGVLFKAAKGYGAWQEPIDAGLGVRPQAVSVTQGSNPATAKFCEPVMKANSSQSFTSSVAGALGITSKPLRIYSMVKYASVARGDAEVFMKFPKAGYREKVWDHAAGAIVVEEAGGVVCDASGNPLDFSGRFIDGLDRGIMACSGALHENLLRAVASSWESSEL